MNEDSRVPLDSQKYFEVASEEIHQGVDLKLVLRTQVRQLEAAVQELEAIVQEYRARYGDLPTDDDPSTDETPTPAKGATT